MEGLQANLLPEDLFHDFELLVHCLRARIRRQIVELILGGRIAVLEFHWQVRGLDLNASL